MNKKQVQQRVLQNGKPLALNKFTWCEKTNTFSSDEDDLVFDFKWIDNVKINCNGWSTQKEGYSSTQTTAYHLLNLKCYMTITGACSNGTKYFVDSL